MERSDKSSGNLLLDLFALMGSAYLLNAGYAIIGILLMGQVPGLQENENSRN